MYKRIFCVVLITLISCLSFNQVSFALTEEQKLFLEAWRIVDRSYLDSSFNHQNWWKVKNDYLKRSFINREETYQAIDQMLGTLDEPFTRLLRPDPYRTLQISTSGELTGVGLQIALDPDTKELTVIAPIANSPAEQAGIQPLDQIIEIDGIKTKDLSLDEAAHRMRGLSGTTVKLTLKRQDQIQSIELVRARITLSPVIAQYKPQSELGYIRLTQFSANATEDIAHAIKHLETQGAKRYILDLRSNPGGLLQAGIEIARLFINQGTIVYTVNRQGVIGSFDANRTAITNAPLVVLVNQGTASASEILAGALQDNKRAIIVGEKTFGKGLIQSLFNLSDGAGLAVTVAKYETPLHHDINHLGITPDQVVSLLPNKIEDIATPKDPPYQAAINILLSQPETKTALSPSSS